MDGYESEDDWTDRWPDDLVLDDTFVDAAEFRERSAQERARESDHWGHWPRGHPSGSSGDDRSLSQNLPHLSDPWSPPPLDDPDWSHFVGEASGDHYGTDRGRPRRRSRLVMNILVMIVVTALVAAYAVSQLITGFALRDSNRVATATLGNEDPRTSPGSDAFDADAAPKIIRGKGWPPSPSVRRTTRVAPAPPAPDGHGSHQFLLTQPDGSTPVAYDPCREIHYVTAGVAQAPLEGKQLMEDALSHLSRLTGLVFVDDGPTDERPSDTRASYQPERYGERWAPVLVAWSDATESPRLAEATTAGPDVLGFAGSSAAGITTKGSATKAHEDPARAPDGSVKDPDGADRTSDGNQKVSDAEMVYVTGMIVLDSPDFTSLLAIEGGHDLARAVLLHELGHLLGLDHVDDRSELMFPTLQPQIGDFGVGDREGLAAVGSGRCMPDI